jgi:tripartite-type tricarboxylate transporter receptor subunit TctC
MNKFAAVVVAMLCLAFGVQAQAGPYPEKPVRLIVPFAAGGPSDITARLLGQGIQEHLGQPIVIENKPGGGAIVATSALLSAEPDGYTIMMASNIIVTSKWLYDSLPYDAMKDLRAIGGVSISPVVVLVPGTSPIKNLADLLRAAREKPGQLNYGSAGLGTIPQLATEFFLQKTGLQMTHIPFRGSGQALPAVIAGQVDLYFDVAISAQSLVQQGQLRAIGVVGKQRLAQFPDVPTLAEQGLSDFDVSSWFGLVGRATLPDDIVKTLNAAMNKVVATDQFKEKIAALGGLPFGGTPEDFRKRYTEEYEMWGRVIPATGLKLK